MLVERCGPPAKMPTKHGRFVAHTYRSRVDGTEHIALVKTRDPGVASKLSDDLDDNSWSYDGDAIEEERPFYCGRGVLRRSGAVGDDLASRLG